MRKFSDSKRAKIMALAAAGLVVGVGGTVTLAAWVDTEWVYGGSGGDEPGVGTSEFVVEQNTTSPFSGAGWTEEPDNPGGSLIFSGEPLALTPGDFIYSPVALRTTVDSIGGNVDLLAAVPAVTEADPAVEIPTDDPGDLLWDTLTLRVGVVEVDDEGTAPVCDADFFEDADFIIITGGLADAGAVDIPIDAAGAAYLHYCFEVGLPSVEDLEEEDIDPTTLQGRTVAPAWEFVSTSVSV